ncbi:MAG TPA: bile acid:sodium symporter family protein [Candidatus Omnitrophota bacterium]|nr:bile acid:sodium symporter family protein [Candidatus Omnitrophota bacterium]HRZ15519.1 bile acid:sodium symporter family protein [Candidatus Omnitrophota bacterium]
MIRKLLERFAKLLVVWVVLAAGVGYAFPQALVPLKPYTDWLFGFTMFGIGCLLSEKDFIPILEKPRLVFLGTAAQFVIMPVLAFCIIKFLGLGPALAVGLILAAAVPDAMAAGVMSYLAEADVAFSVALTTATTLISPVVTPALTYFLGRQYISIQFWPMMQSIMIMVILPLLLGLWVQHRFHAFTTRIKPVFPALSALFIAFICGLVVALNRNALGKVTGLVFVAVISLNVLGLIFGYLAGKAFRFDLAQRRTLAINVGMQNAGMGAVLAIKHISAEAAIPNALFATWCIVSAAVLAGIWSAKKTAAPGKEK